MGSKIVSEIRKGTVLLVIADQQNDSNGNLVNPKSVGSGFFISDEGWLITSLHVVRNFRSAVDKLVAVLKLDESTVDTVSTGSITHSFPEIDVAAIKFSSLPKGCHALTISSGIPEQGESLGIFGYPDSQLCYDNNTLMLNYLKPRVAMCVLARNEIGDFFPGQITQKRLLETQFNFVKGNSGGPIFSEESGDVVGLVMGFHTLPQSVFDVAIIFANKDEKLTGEIWMPPPADMSNLAQGFSWKRAPLLTYATYSYGISCDEINKFLALYSIIYNKN
jgi:hypothetical protein